MAAEALDPIPLSALQHWAYCPRQCALIHVEQVFEENLFTQRGQALHKRVDDPGFELRDDLRIERADIAACDDRQLAAQALCLEEMFGKPVPEGALYYASSRRRRIAAVDPDLRAKTESTVAAVRQLLQSGEMPPLNDDHCHACSLRDL